MLINSQVSIEPKKTRNQKYPHLIRLPKDAQSPTDSIYKRYDIVSQTRVLNQFVDSPYIIRSAEPFTVNVLTNGKVRLLKSRQIV